MNWNELTKNKFKTCVEISAVNFAAVAGVVGVILLCQISTFSSFGFIEQERAIEQNNLKYFKGFATIAANVTVLINAIVLQDKLHKKTITMQNVMADALQVQNLTLLDSINDTMISSSVSYIDKMHFLTTNTPKTSKKFTQSLRNLILDRKPVLNIKHVNDMFTFFQNLSSLDFAKRLLTQSVSMFNSLDRELNSTNPSITTLDETLSNILQHFVEVGTNLKELNFLVDDQTIEDYSKTSRFLVFLTTQYKQLTNQHFSSLLNQNLNNLQSFATSLSLLLESEHNIKQIDEICKFINPHVWFSENHSIIGFPRGLKEMEFLLKDLENEELKKIINRGNTLDELKVLLKPVSNFIAQLASIDEAWVRSDRERLSYSIRRVLKTFEIMNALNLKTKSNFLATVKNALEKLKPISSLKSSTLHFYEKLLNFSGIFIKINSELREFSTLSIKVNKELKSFWPFTNVSNNVEKLKKILYKLNYTTQIEKILTKITIIEKQKHGITISSSNSSDYKHLITNTTLECILKTVDITSSIELEINQLIKYVQLLNALRSPVKIERIDQEKLSNVVMTVKNKMRELPKLEKDFQNEVKKTKREHENVNCLEAFPHSRETAFILALFQQAFAFYEKSALVNIYSEFLNNGLALSRKIESSFLADRNGTEAVIEYFISLNESMALKLQKVTELQKQLRVKGQDPKSIGGALSPLHNVFSDSGRLFSINSVLNNLKATEVGQWNEFLKLEQSLAQFSVIENIVPENIEDVSPLIGKSGWFLRCILAKRIPYENTPWTDIVISVAIVVVALGCTSGIIFAINWSRDFMKEYKRQYGYDHA